MACACKAERNVTKMLNANNTEDEEKGLFILLNKFSTSFLNKIIILLLMIILTPIVTIVIMLNFIFKNNLTFSIPKFLIKHIKKYKNE